MDGHIALQQAWGGWLAGWMVDRRPPHGAVSPGNGSHLNSRGWSFLFFYFLFFDPGSLAGELMGSLSDDECDVAGRKGPCSNQWEFFVGKDNAPTTFKTKDDDGR